MFYVVMLGGSHPRARIEVHDVVFAVAATLEAAYPQLREQWFGNPKGLHIDSWLEVEGVDGYRVQWSAMQPAPGEPRLYFINLGGYEPGAFGEAHHYLLLTAASPREARSKAKQHMRRHWAQAHTDAVMDIDDCIAIDQVEGRYIQLIPGEHAPIIQRSDYLVLS